MDMNVYSLLMPYLLTLITCEFFYCIWQRPGYYNFQDSMANLATAIMNQISNVAVAWAVFHLYDALQKHLSFWTVQPTLTNWIVLFVAIDFLFYWFHRAGHEINILWAAHAPHHSSEELNYTVGARASVTQRIASILFYIPLPLLGFPAEMVVPLLILHHVLQFWPHTRAIETAASARTLSPSIVIDPPVQWITRPSNPLN